MADLDRLNNCQNGTLPYIIRKGDTLSNIALLYNTSVDAILMVNPRLNPNSLAIGQLICVPVIFQIYPYCNTTNYYVVKEGDTLESISAYFKISQELLYLSNYGISTQLYNEQILCIPVVPNIVDVLVNINNLEVKIQRDQNIIRTFDIYIKNTQTFPKGTFKILNKWIEGTGTLGGRWIGLSYPGMGLCPIESINGMQGVADNNIFMSFNDMADFFNMVSVGNSVLIS